MKWVGMRDTYPQHPTGYVCIFCGDIAVMDADGTYLCAPDAIRFVGATIEPESEVPVSGAFQREPFVDSIDVAEVRPTRVADTHSSSPLIWCASEFRHRNVAKPIHP